jgi:hypothetical protein
MPFALRVTFAILGIVAIGHALAAAAPSAWKLGEFILLAALIVLVREYIGFREAVRGIRRIRDPFTGYRPFARAVSPEGFEQAAGPQAAAGESKLDESAEIHADDSVEHIAQVMVTQAFRKVALKYHPDHGGDPEIMRRVYAARELMLRTIRRD